MRSTLVLVGLQRVSPKPGGLVRVRPMGSGDGLGIEVTEIRP